MMNPLLYDPTDAEGIRSAVDSLPDALFVAA